MDYFLNHYNILWLHIDSLLSTSIISLLHPILRSKFNHNYGQRNNKGRETSCISFMRPNE